MQLISTLALATSAAALVAPAAPKASTKLDVATLKNPSSTEFAYGLPGNEIPGVPSSRFDFDPLGFAERASPAEMVKYREAELKHGRVAMLAATGYIAAELFQFPGYLSPSTGLKFSDVPAGLAALKVVPIAGWVQIIFFVGVAETQIFKQDKSKAPGDTAPAGWKRYSDPAERDAKLTSELKNGRLAMMAIMGQMVQQMIWGTAPVADFLKGHYTPF